MKLPREWSCLSKRLSLEVDRQTGNIDSLAMLLDRRCAEANQIPEKLSLHRKEN